MKNLQLAALSFAAIGTFASVSCSTTKGFGQDLQKVGNRIESRADATGGAEPDRSAGTGTNAPPTVPAPGQINTNPYGY